MRKIKLMADYGCFPLWEASPGVVGNIDPRELPISSSLCDKLIAWAERFDSTLIGDDPLNSGFGDPEEGRQFRAVGAEMALELERELGKNFSVIYRG